MERFSPNQIPTYHVEHLATFSTTLPPPSLSSPTTNHNSPPQSLNHPQHNRHSSSSTSSGSSSLNNNNNHHHHHQPPTPHHDTNHHQHQVTPRMALQRLFKMEKTSGIWTQRMAIQLKGNHMWILDGETNDVVERFPVAFIQQPTSFNDQNHIYNNILIFTVQLPNENQGELHIFQCVSHDAINVVDDIYHWMRHYGITNNNHNNNNENDSPIGEKSMQNNQHHHHHHHQHPSGQQPSTTNVNVKEAVNVFNQIAAQRVKKETSNDSVHRPSSIGPSTTPATSSGQLIVQDLDSRSDSSSYAEQRELQNNPQQPQQLTQQRQEMQSPSLQQQQGHHHHHHQNNNHFSNGNHHSHPHTHSHHQHREMNENNYSNERYVSILNHCFDDIERFIIRLQHAAAATRELQTRNKRGGKGSGDGLLAIRARGPCEEEFFEIFSKFKLAFNLLAKLKGCIHDPNAPELVHFLFTPLTIINDAANANDPPVDSSLVGIPYLSPDAIELLSNCCTSKEYDFWQSLGTNWTQSVKHIRMTSPFKPIFADGLAPDITEPELLGIIIPLSSSAVPASSTIPPPLTSDIDIVPDDILQTQPQNLIRPSNNNKLIRGNFDDSDYEDDNPTNNNHNHHHHHPIRTPANVRPSPSSPIDSIEHDDDDHHHHHHQSPSLLLSPVNNNGQQQLIDSEQMEWLQELQAKNAKIVRVLFPRTANNNKELTVTRGEILEILDDSRKWWKARNYCGQIAHVPHTIVGDIEPHLLQQSKLMANNLQQQQHHEHNHHHHHSHHNHGPSSSSMTQDDWIRRERQEMIHDRIPSPPIPPSPSIIDDPKSMIIKSSNKASPPKPPTRYDSLRIKSSATNQQLDTISINSYDTIEQELNDRFNNGINNEIKFQQKIDKTKVLDELMNEYKNKNRDDFSGDDLEKFLIFKEFPQELIDFVRNLFQIKQIRCNLFDWDKKELRAAIPANIANDQLVQRLWSNFLILKNTIKPSNLNTLAFKLRQRKRMMIENMRKEKTEPNNNNIIIENADNNKHLNMNETNIISNTKNADNDNNNNKNQEKIISKSLINYKNDDNDHDAKNNNVKNGKIEMKSLQNNDNNKVIVNDNGKDAIRINARNKITKNKIDINNNNNNNNNSNHLANDKIKHDNDNDKDGSIITKNEHKLPFDDDDDDNIDYDQAMAVADEIVNAINDLEIDYQDDDDNLASEKSPNVNKHQQNIRMADRR